MPSKPMAKRAVAFEACVELRKANCLNEHLLPIYLPKDIPEMANARLAVNSKKKSVYEYAPKPSFWTIKDPSVPHQLWITLILLDHPEKITDGRDFQHIGILTREPLPRMPSFTVYSDYGYDSLVNLMSLDKPLSISDEVIGLLDTFSERVFSDVFNKKFEWDHGTVPYWLTPITNSNNGYNASPQDCIDWETLKAVTSTEYIAWDENTPMETFIDKFLIDHIERSRRFEVHSWDSLLHPDDPVPEGGTTAPGISSIRDYSYNTGEKGGKKKGKKYKYVTWEIPPTEPVLVARRVLHRLNYLDPPGEPKPERDSYICPSAFKISTVLRVPSSII